VASILKVLALTFDDNCALRTAKTAALYAVLVTANAIAWLWAWLLFADRPALLGTALLAYILGIRHAVDADHIAAIDNVVRKLMQDGKRPLGAGFFFALGHSTVVILASAAIALTATAFQDRIQAFKSLGGGIGTAVSASFLLGIGLINVIVLRGVWRTFRRARRGERLEASALQEALPGGAFIARVCGPLFRAISRSWHMYPLGLLFGLGFDTATEIGLLGISAPQAAQGLPVWSILVFPALFTAGMALIDTTDSILMVEAYGWAFINPIRKLWYNLTLTAASIAVAIFIGGVEAAGLIAGKFALEGPLWKAIADLNGDLTNFGFIVIGVFATSWICSVLIYRWKRYDDVAILSD
jgi:nickel/cobalt transporter (NiCoT) family protein